MKKEQRTKDMMSKRELSSLTCKLNELYGVKAELKRVSNKNNLRTYYILLTLGSVRFTDIINAFGEIAFYHDNPSNLKRLYPAKALQIIRLYRAKYVYHDKDTLIV